MSPNALMHESRTPESRGILAMSPKRSWLPSEADAVQYGSDLLTPFLVEDVDISLGDYEVSSLVWNLDPELARFGGNNPPDPTIESIFSTSLEITNGSAATALSSILTILATMSYYDQFPNFAETAHDVSTTYFQPFLFPQSFRGFTAVLAITIAHVLLVLLIVAAFLTSTRLTMLGDHWQTISQTISPATEGFLKKSSRATDKEVRKGLKAEHREQEMANLQVMAEGDMRVGLVARKSHQRSHDMIME
jgi:hypothetical protein